MYRGQRYTSCKVSVLSVTIRPGAVRLKWFSYRGLYGKEVTRRKVHEELIVVVFVLLVDIDIIWIPSYRITHSEPDVSI